jgi:hypothetical protein
LYFGHAGGLFEEQAQLSGLLSMMRLIVPWPMIA